ncbi:MAG: hypothetical protein LH477_08445 [Nocardioides sp.]|nr:hypothetical protein [Nocardioides sp.]
MSGRSVYTSRPAAIFTMLITGFIGAGLLYTAVVSSESRLLFTFLGLFMLAVSVMMLLGQREQRVPWRSVDLAGRHAWAMPLGGGVMAAAAAVVLTVLGVGLALAAVMAPNVGARVISGVLALFLLVVAVTMWGVVVRRPELRISADLVQLRGPGIDSQLAWSDVEIVSHHHLGTRWGALVIRATPGAASYNYQLRRTLLPTDRVPDPPGIHLRTGLLSDEPGLRRLLAALHLAGRDGRESMIARGLPEASGH